MNRRGSQVGPAARVPLIPRWTGRLRRHRWRLTKFGIVGLAGLIADVGGFNVLRYAGGHGPLYDRPLTAKVISTILGIIVAWLGHRYWTFREKRRTQAHREFAVFLVVCIIGLSISVSCLAISHYVLGLTGPLADNVSANILGLGLATAFRYWAMHTHVFTEVRSGRPAVEPRATGTFVYPARRLLRWVGAKVEVVLDRLTP